MHASQGPRTVFVISVLSLCMGCAAHSPLSSNAAYPIDGSVHRVASLKELHEQHVVMQRYDYSCGAASLATLMKYYFEDDVTEKDILDYVKKMLSKEEYQKVARDGLSFLELERIVRSLGYRSASVKLETSALRQLSGPVIVFLKTKNYRHFAVLRGTRGSTVFLADPSRGNVRLSMEEFMQTWRGETFVMGKDGFGTPGRHALAIAGVPRVRSDQHLLRQFLLERPRIRVPRRQ